jgi:hypothetical protein
LTNKGYGQFSHKRSYNLLPLQIFFSFVPAVSLYAWTERWTWLRRATVGLVAAAMAIYAFTNFRLIINPPAEMYGGNVFDGLIEVRQRFPERRVFLVTSRDGVVENLSPDGLFQIAYRITDHLTIRRSFSDETIDEACAQHALICYQSNADQERMAPLLARHRARLKRLPLLNSYELACEDCVAGTAPASR